MNKEQEGTKKARLHETFPYKAMYVYIGVILFSALVGLLSEGADAGVESGFWMTAVIFMVSLFIGSVGVFAFAIIQYALIKFPTQWLAKDKEVYNYDILAALFYSNAIGMLMSVLANQFGQGEDILLASLNAVVITGLFLYFYFYGTDKPTHIKRAIIIVQVLWMVLSLALSVVAFQYL